MLWACFLPNSHCFSFSLLIGLPTGQLLAKNDPYSVSNDSRNRNFTRPPKSTNFYHGVRSLERRQHLNFDAKDMGVEGAFLSFN